MNPEELPSDLHWAELHLDTLVRCNPVGRMVAWNRSARETPAPLFFFAATAHGNLWRVREALPDELTRELCRLAAAERTRAERGVDPERLPSVVERCRDLLGLDRDPEIFRGRAFRLPASFREGARSGAEPLSPADAGELERVFPHLSGQVSASSPCVVARVEGRIVSACYAATGRGPRGALEAGVDTLASQRGRGFGARVVARWAAAVRASGGIPLYSASRSNRASLALAARLDCVPYAETLHLT